MRLIREVKRAIKGLESEIRNHAAIAGIVAAMLLLVDGLNESLQKPYMPPAK